MEVKLASCTKAEVCTPDGLPICEARVFWDSAGLYFLLEVPGDFELAESGGYTVVFFDPTAGLVRTQCLLKPHGQTESGLTLSCTVESVLETIQRRQDLKVPAVTEIEVTVTYLPPGAKGENLPPKGKPFWAETENLSAGGVYFVCNYALPEDCEVQFELKEGPKPIELTAVVLRQEGRPPKKRLPRFGHGCRFLNLKPAAEAGLRSFIFRCQRDMRQHKR